MSEWTPTLEFRWDSRLVEVPGKYMDGTFTEPKPSSEPRAFLQQLWKAVGELRLPTMDDVTAGKATFVGSTVSWVGEWRDVSGLESGLKL